MKRLLTTLLVGAMTISLLTACSEQAPTANGGDDNIATGNLTNEQNISGENSVAIFRGIIDEINDSVAIVIPNSDQEHILSSGDKVTVNLSDFDSEFAVGDEIVVYYTGDIMESYPLQIDTVDVELAEDFDQMLSGDNENVDSSDNETSELLPTAKIAINIEGIVTEVDGDKITLDNGQTVIITDETAFETQNIGETVPIDSEILVGNFIQGFTLDDETLDEVTALVINSNGILEMPTGSVIVNIEGIITEVSEDGNSFLLDNGKWIEITKDTELGITGPNATPKDEQYFEETFRVGNSIAGFTEDINAETVVAYAIYTNWNWENPIKDTAPENDFEIIETEIIINVTSQYDGTLNDELKEIGIISVENIFDLEGTVMYLVKTEAPVEDVITKLQGLSYVNYAEYNMSGTFIDPIFEE